jgi:hypothetical protein
MKSMIISDELDLEKNRSYSQRSTYPRHQDEIATSLGDPPLHLGTSSPSAPTLTLDSLPAPAMIPVDIL